MNIDQIILSTNEDATYLHFWKPVAWAYKKMFPEATIHLAFLTNRSEEDDLVKEFRQYGKVTLFKPVPDVQEFSQAKLIRFFLASSQGEDVCYIDDIDLFPLSKSFITDKVSKRPKGTLLCVGAEVYHNDGRFPVSQITAEGSVYKQFINPDDLQYPEFIQSLRGNVMFDIREDIDIPLDFSKDSYFSDERLIRRLLHENKVPQLHLERGYSHFLDATLDRYEWHVNRDKLRDHGYVNAHGIRPYNQHEEEYKPLIEYIEKNY